MASASRGSSEGAGGSGSECEGEDQDEPSSLLGELETSRALEQLTVQDSPETKENELAMFRQQWKQELNVTTSPQRLTQQSVSEANKNSDELSAFREQWQRELTSTPSPQRECKVDSHDEGRETDDDLSVFRQHSPHCDYPKETVEPQTDEEKAKQLFLRGVEMERGGKLYEAIQHYKRAMQILPDVETRLYESSDLRADTPEEESVIEEQNREEELHPSDEEDAVEGEDLLARLTRIQARRGRLCEPATNQRGAHISWLPYEVVMLILRWVVGAELDATSLERVGAACRGLYVCARAPDLWRALCVRTWGIDCGTPRAHSFDSWRQMFIERPRLNLHGCYISKTTYLRHGENAYQDTFYRPWYLIDYYRYLRFFPDGVVLMWTTAEEPAACVPHLKHGGKPGLGILAGHYRLVGKKVVIIIKKSTGEKKPAQSGNTRFRARRKDSLHEIHEQTFHMELEIRTVRRRRNFQLVWTRYSVSTRRDQWTQFELSPGKFPPFAFSRVRQYTAEATQPLPHTHSVSRKGGS